MSTTPPTPDTKPWWQSKTLIGVAVTLTSAILGIFKIETAGLEPHITEALTALGVVIGSILAIIGRVTARKSLK